MEEDTDLGAYHLTRTDHMVFSVYVEHLQRNDVIHLDGGMANDSVWKHNCQITGNLSMICYDAPQGCIGRRFLQRLIAELKGVQFRVCNYESPLIFSVIIIPMTEKLRS